MIHRYIVGIIISQSPRRGILQSKPPKDTQFTKKWNISSDVRSWKQGTFGIFDNVCQRRNTIFWVLHSFVFFGLFSVCKVFLGHIKGT